MKKLNKYTIIAAAIAMFGIQSCDKQLSEPPAGARVEENAITDQRTAEVALNGVYAFFANVTPNNITDWTSNNLSGSMLSGTLEYAFGAMQEQLNNNVQAQSVPSLWTYAYKIVNAANGVINAVEALPDGAFTNARKNEILGEAKFLRAYANLKLLVYFSVWKDLSSPHGVLLREELSSLSNMYKTRSTVAESYDAIFSDLDFAGQYAPVSNPSHYATKWAAKQLHMRALAMRGQSEDFTKMIGLGDQIIDESAFALEADLLSIFSTKGLASSEVVLAIKPQANQESYYYILSRAYFPGQSSMYVASNKIRSLVNEEPRSAWIGDLTPYQAYSPNTYYFHKFIANGQSPTQLTEVNYVLRLSEVYLMKAEALVRSNGDLNEAKDLLKTVMGNAGITNLDAIDAMNSGAAVREAIFLETYKNFIGEDSIEWMALARMPMDFIKSFKPTIVREEQFYFPVPQDELDQNHAFGEQNPGYGI